MTTYRQLILSMLLGTQACLANICDFKTAEITYLTLNAGNKGNLVFYSQEEIDAQLAGCTVLANDLVIPDNYTSTVLDLKGLKEIKRIQIRTRKITAIYLNDVEKLGSFMPDFAFPTDVFNASKLVYAGSLSIGPSSKPIELPSLERISYLSLQDGTKGFTAPKVRSIDIIYAINKQAEIRYNLSMPFVESLREARFTGFFEDIHFPRLRNVSLGRDRPYDGTLYVDVQTPRNITFPALFSTGSLEVRGVASLSLPALNDTNLLTIGGVDALNVTLPALTWSADVKVTGNLSDVSFPAMTNAWRMSIYGTEFNCDNATLKNDWARMKATWNGTEPCPNPSKTRYKSNNQCGKNTRYYSCTSGPKVTATPSSTPFNTQKPSSALRSYGGMGSVVIAITSALVIGCSWIIGQM